MQNTNLNSRLTGQQVALSQESVMSPDYGSPLNDFLRQVNQMLIFDPSLFDLTLGGQFLNQLLQAASSLVSTQNPGIFRFYINPSVLNQNEEKIVNEFLEKKGWETLQWTETPSQMINMTFSGTSGSMIPIKQLRSLGIRDTKYSMNWLRFQQFRNLIRGATNDLKLMYDGILYEGYVKGLQFTEDAEKPFTVNYSFTFRAYPDRIYNIAAPNTLFSSFPLSTIAGAALSSGAAF